MEGRWFNSIMEMEFFGMGLEKIKMFYWLIALGNIRSRKILTLNFNEKTESNIKIPKVARLSGVQ